MPDYLHNHPDFAALLRIVAQEKSIDPALVEKDYWIMQGLYGLQQMGLTFELKGGTSLSKGYGIIGRFSEDIDTAVYLVETKAQEQLVHPNVKRKQRAALSWCERVNGLPAQHRMDSEWKYVLLGEATFYEWRDKGASVLEMLDFAALRGADYLVQGRLAL